MRIAGANETAVADGVWRHPSHQHTGENLTSGFGFKVSGCGFKASGLGFRALGFRVSVSSFVV